MSKTSPDPAGRIGDLVRELEQQLDLLRGHETVGVPESQLRFLLTVQEHGPITIRALRDLLGVTSSSVTDMTKRLIKSGLVSKIRNPLDERTVVVSLTAAGRRAARHGRNRSHAVYRLLISSMTSAERDAFQSALEQLVEHLREGAQRRQGSRGTRS